MIYPICLGASFHDESFENNGQRERDRVRLEVCGDGDRQVGDGGDGEKIGKSKYKQEHGTSCNDTPGDEHGIRITDAMFSF